MVEGNTVTDKANVTPAPAASTPRQGARADAVLRVLATITVIGVGVQFLLAGAGAFGEGFDPHAVLGRVLGWWTLLLLVVVLVARAGRADIVIAVVLVVLAMFGQTLFAALGREVSGWYGTLHVVNGMVIGGLANRLREGASRRQRPVRRRPGQG
jgi:Family of unknown function (DUF6220)